MGITAAWEVWKPEDPRMHPSSGDRPEEEDMVSDPEARGSGEAVCRGREWGSDTSPEGENDTARNETNNSPRQLHDDGEGQGENNMEKEREHQLRGN